MYSIRQEQMREYIEQKNVVTIKELQALFPDVSLMTIHRDLDALERIGAVVKFRGGAKSVKLAGDRSLMCVCGRIMQASRSSRKRHWS